METTDGDFLKRLLEGDSEFRRIYEAHKNYEKKAAKLGKRPHLTLEEETLEKRLKKMKLGCKDRMEEMVFAKRQAEKRT